MFKLSNERKYIIVVAIVLILTAMTLKYIDMNQKMTELKILIGEQYYSALNETNQKYQEIDLLLSSEFSNDLSEAAINKMSDANSSLEHAFQTTIENDKVVQSLSYYRNLEQSHGASNVIDIFWLSHHRIKLSIEQLEAFDENDGDMKQIERSQFVEKISLEINTHQLLIDTLDAYLSEMSYLEQNLYIFDAFKDGSTSLYKSLSEILMDSN